MKMDAMQKRRMWKVAIAHFLLALFVFMELMHYSVNGGPIERELQIMFWNTFWTKIFAFFEPQLLLFGSAVGFLAHLPKWLAILIFVSSIPLWSICFGWLYVKLTNWLNHFPVLGKRVF